MASVRIARSYQIAGAWCEPAVPGYNRPVFSRLDHVIVAVADLGAATARQRTVLGRDPSWRGGHPGSGSANVLFRLENTYVELLAPDGSGEVGDAVRAHLEEHGEGLVGFALRCDDAARSAETLRARGLHPTEPIEGSGRDEATGAERRWRNVYLPSGETRGVTLFAIEHLSPDEALPMAAAVGPGDSVALALDHLVVMTKDADAAKRLYGEGLGLRMALDRTFEKFGSRLVFFRVGGVSVEIGAALGSPPEPDAPDRLFGLAYRVRNVAAARARIAEAGVDVSEVRTGRKAGTLVCTVRGAGHGVPTLLIGPAPAS